MPCIGGSKAIVRDPGKNSRVGRNGGTDYRVGNRPFLAFSRRLDGGVVWRLFYPNPRNRIDHFQKAWQMRAPNLAQKIFLIILQNRRTAYLRHFRLFGAIDDSGKRVISN